MQTVYATCRELRPWLHQVEIEEDIARSEVARLKEELQPLLEALGLRPAASSSAEPRGFQPPNVRGRIGSGTPARRRSAGAGLRIPVEAHLDVGAGRAARAPRASRQARVPERAGPTRSLEPRVPVAPTSCRASPSAPASQSSRVAADMSGLVQNWYFCSAGGLTTPAMWPDPTITRRSVGALHLPGAAVDRRRRGDVIFLGGDVIDGTLDVGERHRLAAHRQKALGEGVPDVELLQVEAVHPRRHRGRIGVPVEQVERERILPSM